MVKEPSHSRNKSESFLIIYYYFFLTRSEDDDDYELTDEQIDKLLIVTQSHPSTRHAKHEGYDRTGDKTTRVKMTQELEQAINDGLYYYEEDLWSKQEQKVRVRLFCEIPNTSLKFFFFLPTVVIFRKLQNSSNHHARFIRKD